MLPPPPSTPSVPPELLSALVDREFVSDGSARWSVDHATRVVEAKGAAGQVREALVTLERSARPVPRDWLGDRLSVLWTMFMASRTQSDASALTVWLAEHLRLLGDLPHDIVALSIDRAVQSARHGFIPSIGEIRAIAEPLADDRDTLLRRLRLVAAA